VPASALRGGAVNARRPRHGGVPLRGRSGAKSIDGAERSGMMKGVMAVAQIDTQNPPHVLGHHVARSWP
jgi:hypothetical protein